MKRSKKRQTTIRGNRVFFELSLAEVDALIIECVTGFPVLFQLSFYSPKKQLLFRTLW